MEFNKLDKKKTYKQIIDQIISLIQQNEIAPGDKLPGERELALKLGTSRSSVREAFRTLEIIGILEVRHGGGTYVRDFDIVPFIDALFPLFLSKLSNIQDLTDFRILIEGEAVKAAALSNEKNMIDKMRETLASMTGDDPDANEQADIQFHRAIFEATGNKTFIFTGECLAYILRASVHLNRSSLMERSDMVSKWAKEHSLILAGIEQGDPDKAYTALRDHLNGVSKFLLEETSDENSGMHKTSAGYQ